ncbi:MAG: NACHT domain-containing protein [Cyanobacteria bacterium P01_A01_bin.80]
MPDDEDQKKVSNNDLRNSQFGGGFINAEKVNAQRIGGDIWNIRNIFLGNKNRTSSQNFRNPIQQKLLEIVTTEVESRINSSLHNRVYIVLDKEQNPSQVESPWQIEVKVGSQPKVTLQNTEIITVFDRKEIAGRLLILGQPGTGKTTMLLKLAEKLIKRANDNPEHPVPVLFSLSAWKNDNQSIKDWLVEQLKEKYGVRKDIGKQWVENQEIIPLLDGLDEIAAERQEGCVRKINDFLKPENWTNPVVVCSRTKEYQYYETLLQLNTSLELCLFTPQQVYQYLQNTGNLQFWDSIFCEELSQFARRPFVLNIIVLSAQEISVETWKQFKTSDERRFYLFDAYVRRMLKRPYKGKQIQQDKIQWWLGWLAQRLIEEQSTEFLIEKIQPYWLKNKLQIVVYNIIVWGIISGLIYGTTYGLITELNEQITVIIIGLILGGICGISYGLINGLIGEFIENKIEKIIVLIASQQRFSKVVIKWVILGLIIGVIVALIIGLYYGLIRGLLYLVLALMNGLINGLIFGLIGDKVQTIESLKFNQKKSFYRLFDGLIIGLIYVLISAPLYELLIHSQINWSMNGVLIIIFGSYGLIFGIDGVEIEKKKIPNQGIRQSIINTLFLSFWGCIFVTLLILIFKVIQLGYTLINEILVTSLATGLLFGILIGVVRSGTAVIKHLVLRVILWSNGYIPWNYAKFLDYSTNRLFLQRVGGGYRFMHDLLRQHFAKKYAESNNTNCLVNQ